MPKCRTIFGGSWWNMHACKQNQQTDSSNNAQPLNMHACTHQVAFMHSLADTMHSPCTAHSHHSNLTGIELFKHATVDAALREVLPFIRLHQCAQCVLDHVAGDLEREREPRRAVRCHGLALVLLALHSSQSRPDFLRVTHTQRDLSTS